MITENELISYAETVRKDLLKRGYPVGNINNYGFLKSIRTYGRCFPKRTLFSKDISYDIKYNYAFLNYSKEEALETILHEFIHTFPNCCNHKRKFKDYGKIIGLQYNVSIGTFASKELENNIILSKNKTSKITKKDEIRYKVVCLKCGEEFTFKKETNLIKMLVKKRHTSFSHSKCGGSKFWLVIYKGKNVANQTITNDTKAIDSDLFKKYTIHEMVAEVTKYNKKKIRTKEEKNGQISFLF